MFALVCLTLADSDYKQTRIYNDAGEATLHIDRDSPGLTVIDFQDCATFSGSQLSHIDIGRGGDVAENVTGALHETIRLSWRGTARYVFHIGDAPPHGRRYNDFTKPEHDVCPDGDPRSLDLDAILGWLAEHSVHFILIRTGRPAAVESMDKYAKLVADIFLRVARERSNIPGPRCRHTLLQTIEPGELTQYVVSLSSSSLI
jgi:hypothetical protein